MAFTGLDPTGVVAVQNVQEKIRVTTKMCRRTTIAFMIPLKRKRNCFHVFFMLFGV